MVFNASHKILIARFSSIGDIVLTTPIIRCLKAQTNAEIHFVCKKGYRSILEANPYITKVYSFDKDISEISTALKTEQYDCLIDLHKNLRSFKLSNLLNVPVHRFNKLNIEKWLMVNFKINRLPHIHIVDRYFEAVAFANVKNDGQGLDYFIPQAAQKPLSDWLPLFKNIKNPSYIAFAIGAAHTTKRLPEHKIIDLVQGIDLPVVLLGGKNESDSGQRIATASGKQVHNLCGRLSIHESAYIVQQAQAVITHDTGMMHIAAAFQQKIVSIWGNTIPEFGMYPYFKKGVHHNKVIQIHDLKCRPCSKIGASKCPKKHFKCMENIDPLAVVAALKELLDP